MLTSACIN